MSLQSRILFIEDDRQMALRARQVLEEAGYQVDVATGQQASADGHGEGVYDLIAIGEIEDTASFNIAGSMSSRKDSAPLLIITPRGREATALKALGAGAGEVIIKGHNGEYLSELPVIVKRLLQSRANDPLEVTTYEILERRSRELVLLNRAGQALTSTLELPQIIDRLLQAAVQIVGAEGSSVWLWDEKRPGWLVCRASVHIEQTAPLNDIKLAPGQGIAGYVGQTGMSVIVSDVRGDPRFTNNAAMHSDLGTFSLLAVPLHFHDEVIGVLEVVNKIQHDFSSDDRQVIEALASSASTAVYNARLFQKLRERTEELQTQNEELDAFAHTVAHDLQTPLGVISGYAELLQEGNDHLDQAHVQEYLDALTRNAHKMSNIVDELLILAQVRKLQVSMQPLDMAAIVAESCQRLNPMLEEYHAELILPDSWPLALGHAPWVEEIWVNYISNAIKYGGHPPEIVLGADEQANGMVCFWLEDNGQGLTFDEQKRLFIPFSQLSQVRTKGQGLGLSIVSRILNKLEGEAGVISTPGKGSRFTFTLPRLLDLTTP